MQVLTAASDEGGNVSYAQRILFCNSITPTSLNLLSSLISL